MFGTDNRTVTKGGSPASWLTAVIDLRLPVFRHAAFRNDLSTGRVGAHDVASSRLIRKPLNSGPIVINFRMITVLRRSLARGNAPACASHLPWRGVVQFVHIPYSQEPAHRS